MARGSVGKSRVVGPAAVVPDDNMETRPAAEPGIVQPPDNDEQRGRGDLGPWANANFALTASTEAGPGSDANADPLTRFLRGVTKVIRRRLARAGNSDEVAPSIFLFLPVPPESRALRVKGRVPTLDDGEFSITGKLWFVSDVVISGKYVDHGKAAQDDLFCYVVDELMLGHVPAILYDPRSLATKMRFYRQGLHSEEAYDELQLDSIVSLDGVLHEVNAAYEESLITPEVQTPALKLWTKGKSHRTAEGRVQSVLVERLRRAFPQCTIRFEEKSKAGRDDIEIEESDLLQTNKVTRHVVLELKVFRSSNSVKFVRDYVTEGVRQAAKYRDAKQFGSAAVCCFDMRTADTGDSCFAHIRSVAGKALVELRVWFLFRTSRLWREASMPIP